MDFLTCTVVIGAGATAVMDLWTVLRARLLGGRLPDYALVGRWIAYMAHGRFRHDAIAASPPVPNERVIGWTAHYLIGTAFAGILLTIWGVEWARQPTLGPALIVGLVSVAAPFLIGTARVQSLLTHTVFGAGLYAAAWLLAAVADA